MRILFLDDMRVRHDEFNPPAEHELWRAWNGEQALKLVAEKTFDVMFLDHDLADDHYDEHRTGNRGFSQSVSGTEVAKAIAELPSDRRPKFVVVHSWNSIGGPRMRRILQDAGIPCVWDMFSLNTWQNFVRQYDFYMQNKE